MSIFTQRFRRALSLAEVALASSALLLTGTSASAAPAQQAGAGSQRVVRTSDGALRGTNLGGAQAFLGVPFALRP